MGFAKAILYSNLGQSQKAEPIRIYGSQPRSPMWSAKTKRSNQWFLSVTQGYPHPWVFTLVSNERLCPYLNRSAYVFAVN